MRGVQDRAVNGAVFERLRAGHWNHRQCGGEYDQQAQAHYFDDFHIRLPISCTILNPALRRGPKCSACLLGYLFFRREIKSSVNFCASEPMATCALGFISSMPSTRSRPSYGTLRSIELRRLATVSPRVNSPLVSTSTCMAWV